MPIFGKAAPKSPQWYEVEVRPSYNNPRKLKKIMDGIFRPDGAQKYKIQVCFCLSFQLHSIC